MSEVSTIGDIAEGALTARALEPRAGENGASEHGDGHTHEQACLNCGAALIGSYCHACGQAAHVHRTLGAFFHDLLHGVFHFEGKIWRTLPALAFRPGQLTREYIDGRRASYISPIALFLFSVFLLFAVVKQAAGDFAPTPQVSVGQAVYTSIGQVETELKSLQGERAERIASKRDTAKVDQNIMDANEALRIMRQFKPGGTANTGVKSDIPALNRLLQPFNTNPALAIYKLQNSAYKYSWALIPISVPFVWLLFPFSRRYRLYDHTVFVTYSLCFMSLLAVALTLAGLAGAPAIALLAMFVPPLHIYKQLRGTYALSRFGAIWRTFALIMIALAAILLFATLILAESGG